MAFLDPKEDVIEIELTQYGKHLLSKGKFKPYYYAFFDDTILYDSQYGGFTEVQNSASIRIKNVPQHQAQYLYHGVETEINKLNSGNEKIQPTSEKAYSSTTPLGTSNLGTSLFPSFVVNYLQGQLSGSISFLSSSYQTLKIPQLSSSIIYETFTGTEKVDIQETDIQPVEGEDEYQDIHLFEDDSFIKVKKDFLLLEVNEENVPFEMENYDIEVFLCETVQDDKTSTATREQLRPLSFSVAPDNLKSNLVVDEQKLEMSFPVLDTSFVEYFIEINVDNEISDDIMCKIKGRDQVRNIFADRNIVDCKKEQDTRKISDMFKKKNKGFEDCE